MKNAKKFLGLILICLSIFSIPFTGLAHPGRTDKNGGHNDNVHGGYHYHDKNGNAVSEKPSTSKSSSKSTSTSKSSSNGISESKELSQFETTQKTILYTTADTESKSLGSIASGTTITPIEKTKYFVKTVVNKKTGYVRLKHLKVK